MSFHVGQQVVCVSERFSDEEHWRASVRTFPKLHAVYTIREIIVGDVLVGFCFHEFSNPRAHFRNGFHEPAFNSRNFRPVRKTSIAGEGAIRPAVNGSTCCHSVQHRDFREAPSAGRSGRRRLMDGLSIGPASRVAFCPYA